VTLTLRPAPTDTGVVFVNRNGHAGAMLAASVDHLVPTELCTAISGNGFQVKTIEHVLQCQTEWPRLRARARRFVESERSWGRSVGRYAQVYRDLVTKGKRAVPA